ncbi:PQQ-binding-like beta-propeller repeat protein [Polymorphobacter sp. PAMC 29334]|uniref:outer membrane protein assembly factor BamB family protein n=1 Tax=Polymorphobacter sp. PAMC 29334 TaxID=2862331 RepID=UPI001C66DAF3|nr:PQQ-binding-like beta-propeller repeat protein [Polymorphobacter sp. PAMC 29334]QYE34907.1 PQQ-binding-like beta-propeller repeat protein [Polymorphobacter sp. PAMC 29334]
MGLMLRATCSCIALLSSVAGTAAEAPRTDWPMAQQNLAGQRYSTLDEITPANVARLQPAWTYHMRPAADAQARLQLSEATPLVIGTSLYLATPYGRIVALDSTTGAEKWTYVIPGDDRASLRGVAYWPGADGAPAAIVFGTRGGKLISISAADGTPSPGFGTGGIVDLKTPDVMTTGMDKSYILPSPPIVWKNLVITGAGPGEGPGGLNGGVGPAGDTRAWDARTGKLVWTFHSVPRAGEVGFDTWKNGSGKDRSGVNVWGYMTIDAERGILYMPFGAPNNDRVGVDRPGNNLFSSSIVAVSADTGKYLWHFQAVHHDIWDMDTQSPPILFDVHRGGKTIPAVATVNKNALMYILDRTTGKPVFGVIERKVPPSDVPGEQASPTQPFPVVPEPLAQNTLRRDNLYKGQPEHQAFCEKLVDDNNMLLAGEPFIPTRYNRYTVSLPGTQGGVNYYGGAYDPKLGLFVTNINNLAQPMRIVRNADGSFSNSGPLAGLVRFWNPATHLPCGPTPWGQLVAVDVNTGKIAWRSTLGVTDSMPAGQQATGRPGLGGAIVTAGGVTFVGATDDRRFRAFETRTGKEVWTYTLPASAEATPITYAGQGGRQMVAIVATGGGLIGAKLESDVLVVFALPGASH